MKIESLLEIILLGILDFRIISLYINFINPVESIVLIIKIYRNIFIYLFIIIKIILYIYLYRLFKSKLIIKSIIISFYGPVGYNKELILL